MATTTKYTEHLTAIVGGEGDAIELLNQISDTVTMQINRLNLNTVFEDKEAAYHFLKERYDSIEIIGIKTESESTFKFPVKIK